MDKELISVIVPVYQAERTLQSCAESILHQTRPQLELILVDDGSTDASPALCDHLAGQDRRVRVIHQENRGVSAARNAGIEASAGIWLAFVDSDDRIAPTFCEKMHQKAKEGFDIALCGYLEEFYRDSALIRQRDALPRFPDSYDEAGFINSWKAALDDNLLFFPSMKLLKAAPIREQGVRFDPAVSFGEDTLFNQRCWSTLGIPTLGVVPKPLYFYTHYGAGSLSDRHFADFEKRTEQSRKICRWKMDFVRDAGWGREAEAHVARMHLKACFADMELLFSPAVRRKQSPDRRREYLEQILLSPETKEALAYPPVNAEHRLYRQVLRSRLRLLIKGAAWGRLQAKKMRNFLTKTHS